MATIRATSPSLRVLLAREGCIPLPNGRMGSFQNYNKLKKELNTKLGELVFEYKQSDEDYFLDRPAKMVIDEIASMRKHNITREEYEKVNVSGDDACEIEDATAAVKKFCSNRYESQSETLQAEIAMEVMKNGFPVFVCASSETTQSWGPNRLLVTAPAFDGEEPGYVLFRSRVGTVVAQWVLGSSEWYIAAWKGMALQVDPVTGEGRRIWAQVPGKPAFS